MSADVQKATGQGIAQKAIEVQAKYDGLEYLWGGKTTAGFDCSGFVTYVFKALFPEMGSMFELNALGFTQSSLCEQVDSPQAGDLIFFPYKGPKEPDHIGIVSDQSTWIGSQTTPGLKPVKFSNPYWASRKKRFYRYKGSSPLAIQSHFRYPGAAYA